MAVRQVRHERERRRVGPVQVVDPEGAAGSDQAVDHFAQGIEEAVAVDDAGGAGRTRTARPDRASAGDGPLHAGLPRDSVARRSRPARLARAPTARRLRSNAARRPWQRPRSESIPWSVPAGTPARAGSCRHPARLAAAERPRRARAGRRPRRLGRSAAHRACAARARPGAPPAARDALRARIVSARATVEVSGSRPSSAASTRRHRSYTARAAERSPRRWCSRIALT